MRVMWKMNGVWMWNWIRNGNGNWNWNFVMFFTNVLHNVFTFMVISCLFNHFEILKTLGFGSFSTHFPWPFPDGCVAFLLDPRVTPRLNLFPVLNFFYRLADSVYHLLAKFSESFLITGCLT